MEARIPNPALTVPGAMDALLALSKSATKAGIPHSTLDLVHLRASQINGCGVCVDMHAKDLKRAGEADERIFAVAAWRRPRTTPMPSGRPSPWPSASPAWPIGPSGARRRLGRGRRPLRRGRPRLTGRRHRGDQRLEPAERGDPPDRRRLDRMIAASLRRGRNRRREQRDACALRPVRRARCRRQRRRSPRPRHCDAEYRPRPHRVLTKTLGCPVNRTPDRWPPTDRRRGPPRRRRRRSSTPSARGRLDEAGVRTLELTV